MTSPLDSGLSENSNRVSVRQLVLANDTLAGLQLFGGASLSREQLILKALMDVSEVCKSDLVELWTYDWSSMKAIPSQNNRGEIDDHPAADGIPFPESLIHASRIPRRRSRTYLSRFEDQVDVMPKLFEHYQSLVPCDCFVHFPIVKVDRVEAAVIAFCSWKELVSAELLELAHAIVNRLASNLTTMELAMLRHLESEKQAAVVDERSRIARDIHDNLAQYFTAITMQCEAAIEILNRCDGDVEPYLSRIARMARDGVKQSKETVGVLSATKRSIHSVHDVLLHTMRRFFEGTEVNFQLKLCQETIDVSDHRLVEIQSIVTEIFSNIAKHACANNVTATTHWVGANFRISIEDDGVGFDVETNHKAHRAGEGDSHRGLRNMRYRATQIGAQLDLISGKGKGTLIEMVLP
ncbi:MAG: histidine kinase [Planctomycetota bacterium]